MRVCDELLDLFKTISNELIKELSQLDDWGPSGLKTGQYKHDLVADDVVLRRLGEQGLNVVSEESGRTDTNPKSDLVVVVDPVDGSTNASRGFPWYATSLCAVDSDGPLVALVRNLASEETFTAIRSEGASRDGKPITPSACEQASEAIVAVNGALPTLKVQQQWRQTRAFGAVALDLCAVASGMVDAFVDFDQGHGVWDYLGGALICTEAGANIAEVDGSELVDLDIAARKSIVAAGSEPLHQQLLQIRRS